MQRAALLVVIGWCIPAWAGLYSFGGGCASIGAWSQAALNQTENIIRIAETLKDNPNCKGLESVIPKLQMAEGALRVPQSEEKRADRLESIPKEVSALRSFAVADPSLKSQVMELLTSRTLEGASLSAEGAGAIAAGPAAPAAAIAEGIKDMETRLRRASMTGLNMLDQYFALLPSYDRCLIGKPEQGMALLAASVKLAAAFSSSEEGVASRLGDSLSRLVTLIRDRKFSLVLRKLDESEFWLSMSCLLETVSHTYCAARDAHKILNYAIRSMKPASVHTANGTSLKVQNPLEGYYVLVRDVPKISEWLQRIQFGITPKLSTDAIFKNRIWENVTDLMQDVNSIRGMYSEQMLTFATLQDVNAKRNALLKLIQTLVQRMTGGKANQDGEAGKVNFFTLTTIAEMMPFKLIGMDSIPPECSVSSSGHFIASWEQWMLNGGKYQAQFTDPDALAKVINTHLEELIDAALTKASLFFQQRMIVDMSNLVNESVTSQTYTVVDSLKRVHDYLLRLDHRIIDNNDDPIIVPSIRDTRRRIRKILEAYEGVRKIARRVPENDEDEVRSELDARDAYKKVIETAYEQFNVLLQRDTFLSTRLGTFIHYDYAMRIKHQEDMTNYERDLMMASGRDLLDRMILLTNQNPTVIANDLASAQVVNKRNLEALEALFRENLWVVIQELKDVSEGRRYSQLGDLTRTLGRMYSDAYRPNFNGSENPFQRFLGYSWAFTKTVVGGPFYPWVRRMFHAELYPIHLSVHPNFRGADDEFGSFAQFRAKLCAQTMAFEDRRFFQNVCHGAVLKSAFDTSDLPSDNGKVDLDLPYDIVVNRGTTIKPVTSDSICAFNTYGRKNLVYWMTLDLANQQSTR